MNDDTHDPGTAAFGTLPTPVAVVPARDGTEDVSRAVLALYDAHHRDLANFVRALERDPRAAEDIVSETFVRLIDAVRRGRPPDQPRAWLHRVAANLVIDGGRRRTVVTRFLGRLVDQRTAPAPDETVLRDEATREVWDALSTLSPDARAALMLAAHGFSGHEIADAIGRSELATRSLLCRARVRLREQLIGTEGQP